MIKKNRKKFMWISMVSLFLGLLCFFIWDLFIGEGISLISPEKTHAEEGEMVYDAFTLYEQEPISIEGMANLVTDHSYFFDPEQGEIEKVFVRNGQKVKQGDVLFRYKQTGDLEEQIEDTLREQTRLYNQRIDLINSLAEYTGQAYNFQGDTLASYWGEDGQEYYYIVESIGKGGTMGGKGTEPIISAPQPEFEDVSDPTQEPTGLDYGHDLESQIREINQQIEDVEIKLIRLRNKKFNEVKANYPGEVILDIEGKTNSSLPLVRIISDSIQVTGSVSEYEFYTLVEDRPVELYVNAEDRLVPGKIVEYDHIPPAQSNSAAETQVGGAEFSGNGFGNSNSGVSFNFKVATDEYIQPGFSVKVRINPTGLVVPDEAVLEEDNHEYVFLYSEGRVHKTEIKRESQGLQRVVHRGLKAGDQIIMYPHDLKDQQEISIMDPMMGMDEFASEEF